MTPSGEKHYAPRRLPPSAAIIFPFSRRRNESVALSALTRLHWLLGLLCPILGFVDDEFSQLNRPHRHRLND